MISIQQGWSLILHNIANMYDLFNTQYSITSINKDIVKV